MGNYENKEIPNEGRNLLKKRLIFIDKGKNYFFSTVSFILSRLEITTVSPL